MNPTITIPTATIPTNMVINCHFRTFSRMMISGKESAITDIIKAKAIHNDTPFSIKTLTIGIIPAALEYIGIPTKMATRSMYDPRLLKIYIIP